MKKLLSATTALLALAAPAFAADMPVKAAPPAVVAVYSWTGCYIGGQGGVKFGRAQNVGAPDAGAGFAGVPITPKYDTNGFLAGGEAGCNYQTGRVVFGVEGDVSWLRFRGESGEVAPFNPTFVSRTEERWLATIRGRLGYTVTDRFLVYVTGGGADASFRITTTNNAGLIAQETKTRWGWTVGAGSEVALTDNWTFKAEYLFVDFDTIRYNAPPPNPAIALPREVKDIHQHVFRLGLNYRFWSAGPVVARY